MPLFCVENTFSTPSDEGGIKMLTGRILPRITYSMAVTTFSEKQCKGLNTTIDQVMLNKLNVHRNMPKLVIYSPLKWGGLNYPSFQVIQDQKGLLYFLQQLRWNGTIPNDMLVVLSGVQLMSGLVTPIFENTNANLNYIPHGWFVHQHRRLRETKATLWIEHQWSPQLQ